MKGRWVGGPMRVLNVVALASDELCRDLGKRGDARDVEAYAHRLSGSGDEARTLSFMRPASYPERLRPLLSALEPAQAGLVEVRQVDAALGEGMVALGMAGLVGGVIVIRPAEGGWVDEDQVAMLTEQAGLGDWAVVEDDPHAIHTAVGALWEQAEAVATARAEEPLVVAVDQHFTVTGVGLVAIGHALRGRVEKHDTISVAPHGGEATVRSLQVMDDDVDHAVAGDRVGLALRGGDLAWFGRGTLVVHPAIADPKTKQAGPTALEAHPATTFSLTPAPFQKRRPAVDDVCHGALDLQFIVGKVSAVDGDDVTVTWESPLMVRRSDDVELTLVQLDAGAMRILGRGRRLRAA